jgi:hypothetical protein
LNPQDEKVQLGGADSGRLIKAKTSVAISGATTTDVLTAILCTGINHYYHQHAFAGRIE